FVTPAPHATIREQCTGEGHSRAESGHRRESRHRYRTRVSTRETFAELPIGVAAPATDRTIRSGRAGVGVAHGDAPDRATEVRNRRGTSALCVRPVPQITGEVVPPASRRTVCQASTTVVSPGADTRDPSQTGDRGRKGA